MDPNSEQRVQTPLNTPRPPRKLSDFPIVPLVAVFSLLVILIVITLSFLTVYTPLKIPLFESYNKELNLFFYRLPLFPKTSEQILINAVDKNAEIRSYHPNFSLTATLGSSTIEAAGLDLVIAGPVALDEDSMSFDVVAQAAVNYQGQKYEVKAKAVQIKNELYVKMDSVSDSILGMLASFTGGYAGASQTLSNSQIQNNLARLFPYWIAYGRQGIDSEARRELNRSAPQRSIVDTARTGAQDFLLKSNVLPSVKKMDNEEIEGVDSYHLVFKPTREELRKLYDEYKSQNPNNNPASLDLSNEFINGIDSVDINIWIGKKDAIFRKSSIVMSVNLGFLEKLASTGQNPYLGYASMLGVNPKLHISSVLTLKDVNKEFTFQHPSPTIAYMDFSTRASDAFKTEEQKAMEAKKKMADQDLTTIGDALTKYYVAKNQYPSTLIELATTGYLVDQELAKRLGTYTYRVGRSNVAVFTLLSSGTTDEGEQYYGFTSEFMYNRIITLSDLSRL